MKIQTKEYSINNPYRGDIQALRGLAVLLVVFYHSDLLNIPAGYLGVDIFFVISGYLITRLIIRHIDEGTFSFTDFYFRRAKRLLPAAYVVLFLSIVLSFLFSNSVDWKELHAQVLGAITFTTNFVLWDQTGYFDRDADKKVLLHFWSLAIEEQYYILLPALLCFIKRQFIPFTLIIIAILSSILCLTINDQSAAFYLLPFRAWELAIGSFGAFITYQFTSNISLSIAKILSLIIIIYIPFYPIGGRIPGIDAIIVCCATLILVTYPTNYSVTNFYPVKLFAWIGDFSYSLYLTHWPIIVFTNAAWLDNPPEYALWIAITLAFLSAYLLYITVEFPLHKATFNVRKKFIAILIILSASIISLPYFIDAISDNDIDYVALRKANYGIDNDCAFTTDRPFTKMPDICKTTTNPKVLIWGDSYAMAWASALIEPFKTTGFSQATMSVCEPLKLMARFPKIDHKRYNLEYARKCLEFNESVLNYIQNNNELEIIILAGRFGPILDGNTGTMLVKNNNTYTQQDTSTDIVSLGVYNAIRSIRKSGKKVVILAPPPSNGTDMADCLERKQRNKITFGTNTCDLSPGSVKDFRAKTSDFLTRLSRIANVEIIDINDFLCDEVSCKTELDGVHLYRDGGHLSISGGRIIGRKSDLADRVIELAK